MKQNLYVIRDVVSDSIITIGAAPTDGAFVRDCIAPVLRYKQLSELEYYQIGVWNVESYTVESSPKRLCSMDAYKFPENNTRSLSAEEIQKLAAAIQQKESN